MKHRFRLVIYLMAAALLMLSQFVPQGGLFSPHSIYASGNIYYVAKNGSNSNPGTLSQPWLTIQKAASTVKAGDTVYVRAGTYYEWVIVSNSGAAGNPITFAAYPGEYPIIDASAIPNYGYPVAIFNIWNSAYINLKGFEIRNNPLYQGVYVYGDSASNIILQNLKIHGTADSGILIVHDWWSSVPAGTIPNVTIDGCEVYDTNRSFSSQESISFVGVSNFEVKNSKIHDTNNLKEGLTLKPGTNGSVHDNEMYNTKIGIYIDSNSTNVNVYNNNIHNCYSAGIAMGAEQGETQSGISIYNNLSYNNAFGFQALPYNGYKTFSLINNTFYNNASGGIGIYDSGWYQVGCVIRNNIIVGNKGSSVPLLQYAAYPTGITMDHNLFYDSLGYNSVNKYGTSYIQANPLLTSPATDFSLQASSPAISAGSATYAPSVDYAGNARPQSSSYDIGAYEYVNYWVQTYSNSNGTFGLSSGNSTSAAFIMNAQRFQNTAGSGTLTKLELLTSNTTSTGKIRLGVYYDNNGSPGSLLLDAGEVSAANGWVSISNLNLAVTANTYYWLAFLPQYGNNIQFQSSGQPANSHAYSAQSYGPLPGIFTSGSFNSTPCVMRATVSPSSSTTTFGLSSGNSTSAAFIMNAQRFQNTAGSGTLTKLELLTSNTTSTGKIRLGVYYDNNGSPGSLLLDAGEVNAANGWVSISNLNLAVTANTYYWLAFLPQYGNNIQYQSSGQPANSHTYSAQSYGPLPGVFTSGSFNSTPCVMRATVTVY
jgi:hypothetical protein